MYKGISEIAIAGTAVTYDEDDASIDRRYLKPLYVYIYPCSYIPVMVYIFYKAGNRERKYGWWLLTSLTTLPALFLITKPP